MAYYFKTEYPLEDWETEKISIFDQPNNIYQITADSLESACTVLKPLFPEQRETVYLAVSLEDLKGDSSPLVLDWQEPLPERLSRRQCLALSHFQGQSVQYIEKSCFCGAQEYWFLSIERDSEKQWLWLATPYDPPQTWQETTYSKRQLYYREQEIKKYLDFQMLPCRFLLDQTSCNCTSILARYTTRAAQDPWANLFRTWLAGKNRLPVSWRQQELVFLPLQIEPCVPIPITECTFFFSPVCRSVVLEKKFTLDLCHPQTTVDFSVQGKPYRLEIVDAQLINLKDLLTKQAQASPDLQNLLDQCPEEERQLLLGTRLIGEKDLTLQVVLQEDLDRPEVANSFAFGLIGGFHKGIKSIYPGKVMLPVTDPLPLELFTAEWTEEAPPPCKIL